MYACKCLVRYCVTLHSASCSRSIAECCRWLANFCATRLQKLSFYFVSFSSNRDLTHTAVSTKVVPQKRTRQCRLVLWVERAWRWLIEVQSVNQQETNRHKYICLCCFPLYVAETPKISIKDHEAVFPKIPFGIVAYGFVGQPFSKQLYTTATARTTRTSSKKCVSVSDFALEFRIYLKLSSVSVDIKSCPWWISYERVQFQIEIRKTSRCGLRSTDNAELGHFTLLFCRGRQRNVARIGHFRIAFSLFLKASLVAHPFILKWV